MYTIIRKATIVLDTDREKRGLVKLVVAFFEKYCKEMGCGVVGLDTQVENTRPFNFYLK